MIARALFPALAILLAPSVAQYARQTRASLEAA